MKPEAQTSAFDLPCEVCRDLMPLVQDGVASEASRRLVEQHTAHCAACRELWRQEDPPAMPDDRRVLPRIRRRLLPLGVGALYGAAWVFTQLSVCVWQGGRLSFLDVLVGGYMALLHLIGCYLGLLAAALLQYAFAGEEFDHENDEEL